MGGGRARIDIRLKVKEWPTEGYKDGGQNLEGLFDHQLHHLSISS
jgi:hypothetical protein